MKLTKDYIANASKITNNSLIFGPYYTNDRYLEFAPEKRYMPVVAVPIFYQKEGKLSIRALIVILLRITYCILYDNLLQQN